MSKNKFSIICMFQRFAKKKHELNTYHKQIPIYHQTYLCRFEYKVHLCRKIIQSHRIIIWICTHTHTQQNTKKTIMRDGSEFSKYLCLKFNQKLLAVRCVIANTSSTPTMHKNADLIQATFFKYILEYI